MFADRLVTATRKYGVLCVGIDPHPRMIPHFFGGDTVSGITAWGEAIVDIAYRKVGVVKPQIALFERHGPEGMKAFQRICRRARDKGLLVIADAKRGDIGSTAKGYANAFLSAKAPFECDAVTVNPYMGIDSLQPFIETAIENEKGIAVLTRTSNKGADDFQTQKIDGIPLYLRVVEAFEPFVSRFAGATGWSGLMLVVGATGVEEGIAIRRASPSSLFLVPGYGTQNSCVEDALVTFVNGEGGIISASRSVTFSTEAQDANERHIWQEAVTKAIDSAINLVKNSESSKDSVKKISQFI